VQKFIEKIANHLLQNEVEMQNWVVVLPSERAKHYLQKSLFEQKKTLFFAPKIITINQWISSLSSKVIIDKTRLLILLYEIHKTHPDKSLDHSFDEFLNWGNILLSDFDELERYLVDSNQLFKNLKDIKEIENWSFGEDKELSENQKKYLAFWERLPFYYNNLQVKLKEKNSTYLGKVYREVSENPDLVFQENKNQHFLFAGFNALSKAEMSIIKQIHRLGRAHIMIDADDFYLNDNNHEAGMFLRKFINDLELKKSDYYSSKLINSKKQIEVIACSQTSGQVKVAASILANLKSEELNETMILLADESLIIPMFQNIPKSVEKANITLGLPLSATSLKTWLEIIFSIQEGKNKYQRETIYYKDLLACWNHPFIQEIIDSKETKAIYEKEKSIHSKNSIFQSLNSIKISDKVDELMALLFKNWNNSWVIALDCIRKMNEILFREIDTKNEFERAIIFNFDKSLIDFQNCVTEGFPDMNLRSFKLLFNQAWSKVSIAYYGNPTEGLQIMGLLETRLLDFKNIIVVGMNEGKLPPTNPIQSLIPMDLRRYLDLPTPREKQGLFAHHFYRLLHHCEKLTITFFKGAEGFALAEKSRFLAQLELELLPMNPQIKLTNKDYTLISKDEEKKVKVIEKTHDVIQQLDNFCEKGVSVSKLKSFFACPLDFYYKNILMFGEMDQIEEDMESNTFGSLIHSVLEDLFRPYLVLENSKTSINYKHLDQMLQNFKPLLYDKFKAHFDDDESAFLSGKNFLSYQVAIELTEKFLQNERKMLYENPKKALFILGLETQLKADINLEILGNLKTIHLKGFLDRIDSFDGNIRLIDYKSGTVNSTDVSYKGKNSFEGILKACKKSKHLFQLITYTFLYYKNHHKLPDQSTVFTLINSKKNPLTLEVKDYEYQQLVEIYPDLLKNILEEIYDESTPFQHKEGALYCKYC
jgi:ATP-dependent helicase/nuclease subunit B